MTITSSVETPIESYNPFDFWKFDINDVITILENYQSLSRGEKLDAPNGWDNPESQKASGAGHPSWENPVLLCAEICRRVRVCGTDGLLVKERYGLNDKEPKTIDNLSVELHMDAGYIDRHINWVTAYCTGRRLRRESYYLFCRYRHYLRYLANENS